MRSCWRLGIVLPLVLPAIALAAPGRTPVDVPTLRPGMWRLEKGEGKQAVAVSRCCNPSEELLQQFDRLRQAGARVAPVKRRGNTWTFEAEITMQDARGHDVHGRTVTRMTVRGATAYSLRIDNYTGEKKTTQTLTATRTGECPK